MKIAICAHRAPIQSLLILLGLIINDPYPKLYVISSQRLGWLSSWFIHCHNTESLSETLQASKLSRTARTLA